VNASENCREDYSENGDAWNFFMIMHDLELTVGKRWYVEFPTIGNGFVLHYCGTRGSLLKERLFGLTNSKANHGEDVKSITSIWTAHQHPI
jgi:hypothetical protein